MTTLRISVTGTKDLQRALKRMNPEQNSRIFRGSFKEMARLLLDDVVNRQIAHGRGDKPPLPTRLTNRSGGRGLVGNIAMNEAPLPKAIEVGTDLVYGAVHEEGRAPYPKRAFLQPALDKLSPKFPVILKKHWKKEAKL